MLTACVSIEHSEHEYIQIMTGSWVSALCLAVSLATWNPCLAAVHFLLIQASVSVDWNRFAVDLCCYAQQCFLLHNAMCSLAAKYKLLHGSCMAIHTTASPIAVPACVDDDDSWGIHLEFQPPACVTTQHNYRGLS